MLQLSLYAAGFESLHPGVKVVGGAYLHLAERIVSAGEALVSAGELTDGRGKPSTVPFDPQAARTKALELAGRIRAGDFSLTEHDRVREPNTTECTHYCPMRNVCRQPEGYKPRNAF